MSEGWSDEARADDDETGAQRAPRSWSDPAAAASLLRAAAVLAFVMWAIGFVSSMWFQWSQLDGMGSFAGQQSPSRLLGVLASGFTATWGYLLVAVVALTASTVLGAPGYHAAARSAE